MSTGVSSLGRMLRLEVIQFYNNESKISVVSTLKCNLNLVQNQHHDTNVTASGLQLYKKRNSRTGIFL